MLQDYSSQVIILGSLLDSHGTFIDSGASTHVPGDGGDNDALGIQTLWVSQHYG